jgi:uncharacterized protein
MIAQAQHVELDTGPHARASTRLCIATRAVLPVSDLIRFVIGPDGDAVPDIKRKLPGRGIWVTATQAALDQAIRSKAFARAFKREVGLPSDLVARTQRQLERAALDALAIAGKAGLAAAGFTMAAAALERGEAVALFHAVEASAEGIRKLDAALRRGPAGALPVIGFLTSAQLDLALNRANVIHAALLAGPVSETFLARCRRLERFRDGDQHNQAATAGSDYAGHR